ncbi:hypothetical protein SASPL_101030 [Salvia splendens]|uniref:Uncharacterized protein n=1 Tax=Salvia splendens TaxID=180675 RepID=A0A8X8YPC4_SALSN|nr:hypothetical protein SASPL_101030 [Salvia splendens]
MCLVLNDLICTIVAEALRSLLRYNEQSIWRRPRSVSVAGFDVPVLLDLMFLTRLKQVTIMSTLEVAMTGENHLRYPLTSSIPC